ncbi:MAG TPA: hypothetical protein VLW75_02115 [Rhizomicrobium sp.]|nr:hypothetical protein [Rhizomicrobium sp.]
MIRTAGVFAVLACVTGLLALAAETGASARDRSADLIAGANLPPPASPASL